MSSTTRLWDSKGASKRAVFIIDEDCVIRYSWISEDPMKEPNYKEIQETLENL